MASEITPTVISIFAALGTCISAFLTYRLIKTSNKQIGISKEANDISKTKSEKDMIYQIHKDAYNAITDFKIDYTRNTNGIDYAIKLSGTSAIESLNNKFTKYFQNQEANPAENWDVEFLFWANDLKSVLSKYYYPLTLVIELKDKLESDSKEFANNLLRSYTPRELSSICWLFTCNQSIEPLMKSEEAKDLFKSISGLSMNIGNLCGEFTKPLPPKQMTPTTNA